MSGTYIGTHFKRLLHGTLPPLALVAITILPLLFGGLFVWSYYDPIGNLNKVPVALVNSDKGAPGPDGEMLYAGKEVEEKLLEVQPMHFELVSPEEAKKGIADGTYYLGVEIPTDFSEAVTSVQEDDPHPAKLNVTLNNTNGFIPTMLGNQVTRVMTSVISETVGETITHQLFVGFNTVGEGMDQASDGANKLHDGTSKAKDGGVKLRDGAGQLNEGLNTANDKIPELVGGIEKLDNGAGQLHDGAARLNDGLSQASDGADQLANGLGALKGGADRLGDGAGQIAGGVDKIAGVTDQLAAVAGALGQVNVQFEQALRDLEASPVPAAQQVAAQIRELQRQLAPSGEFAALGPDVYAQVKALQDGTHELAYQLGDPGSDFRSGIARAGNGADTLAQALHQLSDGSGQLLAATTQLKDGTSQLVVGARTLADGTSRLADGSDQLVVGVDQLNDGLIQLDDGSGELALKITEGAEELPRWHGERLDKASEAASSPVRMVNTGEDVTTFGQGLSPFFLSLSLWFGGLITFMIYNPLTRRIIDSGANPARMMMANLIPAVLIGAVQAFNLWWVQTLLLKVDPVHPAEMLGILVFVSAVFMTLILALNSLLGAAIARFLAMILMSLQLVSSNGLYPPEVQPKFIQWMHTIDPMRFSVDLVRFCLFGGAEGNHRPHQALIILAIIGVLSFIAGSIGYRLQRTVRMKDIHPELQV
ncbi:YhgE/Pip domain-containing protein [Corynebacterium aquatimens]